MKKILYIILIIAVIGGGIYAWFYFSKPGAQSNPVTSSLPQVSSPTSAPLPASYSIADTFPKTETINIGTGNGAVEVKNFYKKIVDTEEGFVIMADNENYQISYDRSDSKFYIDIRIETAQQTKAESEFLTILGIGQQDACKLDVFVFHAGQSNGTNLSFCVDR